MFRASADPSHFRRFFARQVLLPISLLIIGVLVAAALGLYWATRTSNEMSLQRQKEVALRGLVGAADQLAYEQQGIARWDQLTRELDRAQPDRNWLDREIGRWLSQMYSHDMTFILDGQGRPIYAFVGGQPATPRLFLSVQADFAPMIVNVRRRASGDQVAASAEQHRSTAMTRPDTLADSYVTTINNRPAAASVMVIADGRHSSLGERPLLVSARFIDATYLKAIAAWSAIDSLRFSPSSDKAPSETRIELKDPPGKRIGYFLWKPELPGSHIVRVLGPITAGLILLMAAAMGGLIRSLWRSTRQLAATVVDLRASEAQAQHLAFHDVLTGLPNRALFQDRMEQSLARARRGHACAILALDLDRFKHVNDTLGHSAGDTLIRLFADRLLQIVRQSDTVARLGGDEFSIISCDTGLREDVMQTCDRILAAVRDPFDIFGNDVFVGVSIGVVLVPEAGSDRNDLVRKADIALYRAKNEGRNCYRLFSPSMDATVRQRAEIEEDLRRAMARGDQLEIYLQPEVEAGSRCILGLEALLRWNHPEQGLIPPERFIPIAEETGLIAALGEWVLSEACRISKRWPQLFIAVNLSGAQFRAPDLAERVIAIVEAAQCDPRQIELEITESILLEENEIARDTLGRLREAGFRVALDDFGTGYSSLSYLRQFKVDKIKIDRSFTQNLAHDHEAAAIVTSVVTMGHAMGLTVTAEGVETPDQMQLLSSAGCNELQGYLFSQPVPENIIADIMAGRACLRDVA